MADITTGRDLRWGPVRSRSLHHDPLMHILVEGDRTLCSGGFGVALGVRSRAPHHACRWCVSVWKQQSGVTVERTESHVQCECPPALCRHQPDGYRVVIEWGAWDERGNFLGTFDTKREAMEATGG